MKPSDIYMIDGSENKVMRYITAQSRTAARALGMGGVATYTVLRGRAATMRITNKTPGFIVAIPDQAQPESYFTLASFEPRKNETREVITGGGYMSYSSGIHKSRIIDVTSEKMADQSRAPKSFTIYKLTPVKPMNAGEYALVLYTGELQSLVSAWFTAGTGNSYFDFGIDK
ncbi:MAG: hypothetical protein LBM04_04710 [Opitutaceae bacterium]|nr:hypothetical protein [Opitutaceae bacterium]